MVLANIITHFHHNKRYNAREDVYSSLYRIWAYLHAFFKKQNSVGEGSVIYEIMNSKAAFHFFVLYRHFHLDVFLMYSIML